MDKGLGTKLNNHDVIGKSNGDRNWKKELTWRDKGGCDSKPCSYTPSQCCGIQFEVCQLCRCSESRGKIIATTPGLKRSDI